MVTAVALLLLLSSVLTNIIKFLLRTEDVLNTRNYFSCANKLWHDSLVWVTTYCDQYCWM